MVASRIATWRLLPVLLAIWSPFWDIQAKPLDIPFTDCMSDDSEQSYRDSSRRINITSVYAQIADYGDNPVIKITAIGDMGQEFIGATPDHLATLFVTTDILSFGVDQTASAFCAHVRSPLSVQAPNYVENNCSIPAGKVAFSAFTPYRHDFSLTTLNTRFRAVDGSSPPLELVCLDIAFTPVEAKGTGGYYGKAQIIFWFTIALTISYWLVVGLARIAAAWGRAGRAKRRGWMSVQWAGTVLASAISGERLSASPALLRFATPSARDVIFHTQWCAGLAMVAVQWPDFTYPILRNTAWATLVYNVTLIQGTQAERDHWDAIAVQSYEPPQLFADQMSDRASPLYLDANVPNSLLHFPNNTGHGMPSFAYTIGIRPQDLFGTCLALYLTLIASVIIISLIVWAVDWLVSLVTLGRSSGDVWQSRHGRSPKYSGGSDLPKEGIESPRGDNATLPGSLPPPPTSRGISRSRRAWWHYRLGQGSFHGNILYGNLVRLLLLFHFPISCYSCYQLSLGRPSATIASLALAGVAFAFFSLLLPAFLLFRLFIASTGRLYEATRTLLMLGPLYNHFTPESQRFASIVFMHSLAMGVVIGAGQKSGTAQAIILLIVEVFAALATSMWLPWRDGAHMGAISFMFCVGRIITCVLLVILSPIVNVGHSAGGWVAYAVLILNGLIYLTFLLMLIVKIIEGSVRFFGEISFDRSRHEVDSGLLGAIGMLPCCGRRKRRRSRRHAYRPNHATRQHEGQVLSDVNTQNMLAHAAYFSPYLSTPSQPQQVPSYLRPEQASTPYREEGDDPDGGYILGAFHEDFLRAEQEPNLPYQTSHAPASNSSTSTGFTRIKGGRAHFDSPYAIQAAAALPPVPAPARSYSTPLPPTRVPAPAWESNAGYPPTSFTMNPNPSTNSQLSVHARKKSESAVIEDASNLLTPRAATFSNPHLPSRSNFNTVSSKQSGRSDLPRPVIPRLDDDSTESASAPRKKKWFGSNNKRSSESYGQDDSETDGEPSSPKQTAGDGYLSRWGFRRQRNKSEGDGLAAPEGSGSGSASKSFVVVRGPRNPPPQAAEPPEQSGSRWNEPSTSGTFDPYANYQRQAAPYS